MPAVRRETSHALYTLFCTLFSRLAAPTSTGCLQAAYCSFIQKPWQTIYSPGVSYRSFHGSKTLVILCLVRSNASSCSSGADLYPPWAPYYFKSWFPRICTWGIIPQNRSPQDFTHAPAAKTPAIERGDIPIGICSAVRVLHHRSIITQLVVAHPPKLHWGTTPSLDTHYIFYIRAMVALITGPTAQLPRNLLRMPPSCTA
jgi:hypothetical protein